MQRQFCATRPNELWVADATYVPTVEGVLYLAIILDVFARRIVGWSMAAQQKYTSKHFLDTCRQVELPQFGGHLQLENNEESVLREENTTLWSIENRS